MKYIVYFGKQMEKYNFKNAFKNTGVVAYEHTKYFYKCSLQSY